MSKAAMSDDESTSDGTSNVTSDEDQIETNVNNKHKCQTCGKAFSYRKVLAKHMKTHSDEQQEERPTFDCHICGKVFTGTQPKRSLTLHLRTHSDEPSKQKERKFKCDHCGKAFPKKSTLQYHINSLHTENKDKEKAACPLCGKMLAIGYVDRHIEAHAAVPEKHECPQCGKICGSKKSLKVHTGRVHSTGKEYSFNCEICGNNYKNMASLREHITKIHSDDKRPMFECTFCDKKFLHKPNLVEHERLHTGEKPFFCQHCNESFRLKAQLKRHEQIHTGGKPYKCATCAKTFGFLQNLKTHMLIHSEHFPYACPNAPNCPKRFKQKGGSKLHFKNCRARKPSVSSNEEEDLENDHSSVPKRHLGPRPPKAQQSDQSKIIWKECTVSIKRTDFIEKAIWLGYSSLTRVSHHDKRKGKLGRTWVNTAQIGAGPGPKKRKMRLAIN